MDSLALVVYFMIPYSVWGVCIFSGTFKTCNDITVDTKQQCIGYYTDPSTGIYKPRVWKNTLFGFDHAWTGFLSLFEMMMEEGWSDKMFAALSIVGPDMQPKWPNPQVPWWNAFYFLGWMMFGFVILRYLFVGVIMHTFMTRNGTALLSASH